MRMMQNSTRKTIRTRAAFAKYEERLQQRKLEKQAVLLEKAKNDTRGEADNAQRGAITMCIEQPVLWKR